MGSTKYPCYAHNSCRNAERFLVSIATDVDKFKKSGEPKAQLALQRLKKTDSKKYRENIMELMMRGVR